MPTTTNTTPRHDLPTLLYTRAEACAMLRVKLTKLRELEAAGLLRPTRIGRLARYTPDAIHECIRRLEARAR